MSEAMHPRDELLRRLLLDEADPLAAFDASELAGDAAARAELEELLEAERRLGGLGADEREALRPPATGSAQHAAEERVVARVRERLGVPRPRRVFGARAALLAAAGLALVLGLRWLGRGAVEPDPGTLLGGRTRPVIERPIGAVEGFAEVVWSGPRAADQRFRVRVLDGREPGTGRQLAVSPLLVENRWAPGEEEWKSWPHEILLRVELLGSGPDEVLASSDEVRAQR